MKYVFILILLTITTKCLGQAYWVGGGFKPPQSPYFRVPVDTKIFSTTYFIWGVMDSAGRIAPWIDPSFSPDTPAVIIDSIKRHRYDGPPQEGSDSIFFFIQSNVPLCFNSTDSWILAYYSPLYLDSTANSYYYIQGVIYDPNIIGKLLYPDSLIFSSTRSGSSTNVLFRIVNDSLARYRQIKVLSVHQPFSVDDTVEMMYPCEDFDNKPDNCYFHPTKPGHYVDTAKLLDELTNDTISVVLIGDAYDAGVSKVSTPDIKIYPDPCDREFQIEMPAEGHSKIEIWNLYGARVYSSH